jgi:hypothetical protein
VLWQNIKVGVELLSYMCVASCMPVCAGEHMSCWVTPPLRQETAALPAVPCQHKYSSLLKKQEFFNIFPSHFLEINTFETETTRAQFL